MKKISIICILFFLVFKLFSQDVKLFFISGQYYDTERELSQMFVKSQIVGKEVEEKTRFYNSYLFQLVLDSLITIDTLSYYKENDILKNEEFRAIRLYQEKKTVIIYSKKRIFNSNKDSIILKQINFDNPYSIYKYSFIDDPFYKYWTIFRNGRISIVNEKVDENGSVFKLRNIPFKTEFVIQPDSLNLYISDGCNGLGLDDIYGGWGCKTEKMELVKDGNCQDSIFKINHVSGTYILPSIKKLNSLDSSISNMTPKNFYIRLSISSDFLLSLPQKAVRIGDEWYRVYYFYNKQKDVWSSKKLPGTYPCYRIFGKWIGGTKTYMANKGYDERIRDGIEIPGKKFRSQEYSEHESPADFRFNSLRIFPTGRLFLYNIDTDKYIDWDVLEGGELQGDSEVLLVMNETVYYRVNDKIYKSAILNNSKLGEKVLLIHDIRVPSIHWAFISGN